MMTDAEKAARKAQREADQKARLAAHIKKAVDGFPPITDEQATKVASLLWPRGQARP